VSESLTVAPQAAEGSFLGVPVEADLDRLNADIAVLGIPYCAPYAMDQVANDQSRAPAYIRSQSRQFSDGPDHWDFDLGGPLLDGDTPRIVDCGDVRGIPGDLAGNLRRAEDAVGAIRNVGAVPLVIGGDHGATVPVLRAYAGAPEITLVHVDAHLDWRDEVNGVRDGYSSPIRRASELPWVGRIVQIGLRGTGSARRQEVEAARAYGAELVTAERVHRDGIDRVLDLIPAGQSYYLTIDADGLDPTIMPGVCAPVPGGLTFPQIQRLIHGLADRGRVVGMDVVEVAPSFDSANAITAVTAGRLFVNMIGAMVRAGHFQQRSGL